MPIYKHSGTGNHAELSRAYVSAFPEGTWDLVEDEGPKEKADRELRELLDNKVTVDNGDGTDSKPETAAQRRAREKAEATAAAEGNALSAGDLHPPAATIVTDQEGAK